MQIRDIAWSSLKRRKGRFGFVLAALALGVGTIVALVALTRAMQAEVSDELDRFGANIVITPRSNALDLGYGGLAVGGVNVDATTLRLEDVPKIRTIPNRRNINAVAPKLIGTTELEGSRVLLVGVDHRQEARVKSWWHVDGRLARTDDEVLLGAEAARALKRRAGDSLTIGGSPRRVTGVVASTGSIDDQAVFAAYPVAEQALDKRGAVSLIEVSALCRGCPIEDIVNQIATVLPNARVAPIRQAVAGTRAHDAAVHPIWLRGRRFGAARRCARGHALTVVHIYLRYSKNHRSAAKSCACDDKNRAECDCHDKLEAECCRQRSKQGSATMRSARRFAPYG
jgi:putative ABC transport system permease protein